MQQMVPWCAWGGGDAQRQRTLLVYMVSVGDCYGVGGSWSAVGACVSMCFRIPALLPAHTLAHRLYVAYLDFAPRPDALAT